MTTIHRCQPMLGTFVEISITAEASERALLVSTTAAFAEIERLQRMLSFHDPASQLSHLNHHAYERRCRVPPELAELLARALALSQITQGIFDVTIAPVLVQSGTLPDRGQKIDATANWADISLDGHEIRFKRPLLIDLGGIAKGYAVDGALALFDESVEVSVNAGGDMRMSHWIGKTVGIRHPSLAGWLPVPMQAAALATSADYFCEGRSVMVLPQTRQPVADQRSFSVFAADCVTADALTKVAFLAANGGDLIRSLGAHALVIERNGSSRVL